MTHYNAYESFKTKKSIAKKIKAKEKISNIKEDFIITNSSSYGIVIEVKYNDAYILYNGEIIKAKLRKDLNLICNQTIFPGDKVVISNKSNNYIIDNLLKRTSLLTRTKKDSTKKEDIGNTKYIAANIDLAVIVVSAKEPPLHPKFIDRYLMILDNNNIPSIIVLNKSELKTKKEEEILKIYKDLSIPVIETSTYENIGIDTLKKYLLNKQAILIGNSGVGKSSLINILMDTNEIKTSHIGEKSKRGRHTTTSSKYYIWEDGSSIIDTPGIRSLDISNFKPSEIQNYFKEFNEWKNKCKYNNCLHYHEPYDSCAIKQGVNTNIINKNRYESYLRILKDTLGEEKTEV